MRAPFPKDPSPEEAARELLVEFDLDRDLNDVGNAERIVRTIGREGSIVFVEGRGWFRRMGHLYEPAEAWVLLFAAEVIRGLIAMAAHIADDKPRALVLKHAQRSLQRERLSAALALAAVSDQVRLKPGQVDCVPYYLGCENGVLDLRIGELCLLFGADSAKRGEPDVITRKVGTIFDPTATCLHWVRFLFEVFDDDIDLIEYVQRAVGYTLSAEIVEHVLFFLLGGGANGKSVFLTVLGKLLGDYAVAISSETLLSSRSGQQSNDLARLPGRRLATSNELEDGRSWNEPQLKSATGGDVVVARLLYHEPFEFRPVFKLFIAGNHKPRVRGTDEGIWRRIQLIPFDVFFPPEKRDRYLVEKLCDELPGILNWALEGHRRWREIGLSPPPRVLGATAAYRAEEDRVGQFLDERCERGAGLEVHAAHLFNVYKGWSEARGDKPLNMTRFGNRITEHGIEKRKQGVILYCGIALRPGRDGQEASNPAELL